MKNNNELNSSERLNQELIDLKKSSFYTLGKRYSKVLFLLKRFKFFTLVKRYLNNKRIMRISHLEVDNDFHKAVSDADSKLNIVVYTCIVGGYDKLRNPFAQFRNVDYVAFIDKKDIASTIWNVRDIPESVKRLGDAASINRYIKFHPYELFEEKYDIAVYIDGNISVVGDLSPLANVARESKTGLALHKHRQRDSLYDEAIVCEIIGKGDKKNIECQVDSYRMKGFPDKYGLFECNVIVSDLHNEEGRRILNEWWAEYSSSRSGRDQLSFPYVLWKNGYEFSDVGLLGKNIYRNPKFIISEKTHEVGDEY